MLWSAAILCERASADDAARSVSEKLRIDRLARLGKAWGTVRYVHPFLAYQDLDWDAAIIKAIPKVEAAKTKDEYAAAVGEMLAMLGDPATGRHIERYRGKPTEGERIRSGAGRRQDPDRADHKLPRSSRISSASDRRSND